MAFSSHVRYTFEELKNCQTPSCLTRVIFFGVTDAFAARVASCEDKLHMFCARCLRRVWGLNLATINGHRVPVLDSSPLDISDQSPFNEDRQRGIDKVKRAPCMLVDAPARVVFSLATLNDEMLQKLSGVSSLAFEVKAAKVAQKDAQDVDDDHVRQIIEATTAEGKMLDTEHHVVLQTDPKMTDYAHGVYHSNVRHAAEPTGPYPVNLHTLGYITPAVIPLPLLSVVKPKTNEPREVDVVHTLYPLSLETIQNDLFEFDKDDKGIDSDGVMVAIDRAVLMIVGRTIVVNPNFVTFVATLARHDPAAARAYLYALALIAQLDETPIPFSTVCELMGKRYETFGTTTLVDGVLTLVLPVVIPSAMNDIVPFTHPIFDAELMDVEHVKDVRISNVRAMFQVVSIHKQVAGFCDLPIVPTTYDRHVQLCSPLTEHRTPTQSFGIPEPHSYTDAHRMYRCDMVLTPIGGILLGHPVAGRPLASHGQTVRREIPCSRETSRIILR